MKRVTTVTLANEKSTSPIVFNFRDPSSQLPYQISKIDGLDPEDIMWGISGSGYEAKLRGREIVARARLNPQWSGNQTYADLRSDIQRLIQSTRSGLLEVGFYDDEVLAGTLSGKVVKMEADLFVKDPTVDLTIACTEPAIYGPALVQLNLAGLSPASTPVNDLVSTMPHGVWFLLKFNAPATTFKITADDGTTFQVTPIGTGGFQVDDVIGISSLTRSDLPAWLRKGVYLSREERTFPIMDAIHSGSNWPTIFPTTNHFQCTGNVSWLSIAHPTTYWGV